MRLASMSGSRDAVSGRRVIQILLVSGRVARSEAKCGQGSLTPVLDHRLG